ncbi:MAG TPA: GNVR domain-containing protein [Burkholderiales bacterium]
MTDLKTPHARKADEPATAPLVGVPYVYYREEQGLGVAKLLRLLKAECGLIAAIIGVATAVSVVPFFLMTPVYRAETLLAPVVLEKHDGVAGLIGQFGDLAQLVERYVGASKDQTAESIATLRSRALATAFIEERKLKPELFAERWDREAQRWRGEAPSDFEAYELFDRRVRRVLVDRRSGLVTLAIEWRDPERAAAWANALVAEVNARRRAEAIREAAESIRYLEQQLAQTSSVEIRQALYRLIEAQTKAIALARTRPEYAFKVIDPAVAPGRPVRPQLVLLLAIGLAVGIVVAVVAVLLRRALRSEAGRAQG